MSKEQRGVSTSQINNHRDCPYKLYLLYAKKQKPMYFKPQLFDVGAICHDSTDGYYENHYSAAPSYDYLLYWLYEEIKQRFPQIYSNSDDPEKDLRTCYEFVKGVAKIELKRVKQNPYKPYHEYVNKNAGGYYIKVDIFDEILVFPLDWKSSATVSVGFNSEIQACVYKIGLEHDFNVPIKKFYFVFPVAKKIRKVEFHTSRMRERMDFVEESREQIQKSFRRWRFEKKPRTPKMCNYCEFSYCCSGVNR